MKTLINVLACKTDASSLYRPLLKTLLLVLVAAPLAATAPAQTVSQDYARYASMLNQERADTARREQQNLYDQSSRNARSGSSSGSSSGGSYSGSSSGGGASSSIGMLSGTFSSMMDRHNAAVANRQARDNAARAAYEERNRARIAASDEIIAGYERAREAHRITDNLAKAANGDIEGLRDAAWQYFEGSGVAKNVPRSFELFTDAGKRGDLQSMVFLEIYYGKGVPGAVNADMVKSHDWGLKAAEAGDVGSMGVVCKQFMDGVGTAPDFKAADKWCTDAIAKDDAVAANNLAYMYSGDIKGVPVNRERAEALYRKSMALGNKDAAENLIAVLSGGDGGIPDYDKLFVFYKEGAAKGDPVSETNLGILYIRGYGAPLDAAKSVEWLNKAIKDGSTRAPYELGLMYDHGVGVPKDKAMGYKLMRQSAVQGWPAALFTLGLRAMNGDGVQQDQIEGERLLHLAADKGDADAPYVLYQIYDAGYGVEVDHKEAMRWLKLGAERGDEEAIKQLKKLS